MRIYNPILYVGLGGTGLHLGARLERQFRQELCGPDGLGLVSLGIDPFQLPAAIQFVYADFDENDTGQVRRRIEADNSGSNVRVVPALAPAVDSYSECVESLKLLAPNEIRSWVPPTTGQPDVAPLRKGAGAFPTVGRAAFWQTLAAHNGYQQVEGVIQAAISEQTSQEALKQLHNLAGRQPQEELDVFVGFSMAGGTGCGVFYDFLHILADTLQSAHPAYRIYPLVMLPSVIFTENRRKLELNAARGLLDLFTLVDFQNTGRADEVEAFTLRLPDERRRRDIHIKPARIPTAFLFSRPAGLKQDDMYASVSSLLLSISGTELAEAAGPAQAAQATFASWFINEQAERQSFAATGVGRRSVSSGLVASISIPHDQIATIVADYLLALAVRVREQPSPQEDNSKLMAQFVANSGLQPLRDRSAFNLMVDQIVEAKGHDNIIDELRDRGEMMQRNLATLSTRLEGDEMPKLVQFDYRLGIEAVLDMAGVDPFRALRAIRGDDRLDGVSKGGVRGFLQERATTPRPPVQGFDESPPDILISSDRLFGLLRVRPGEVTVQDAVALQDDWFEWRKRSIWARNWSSFARGWNRTLEQLDRSADLLPGCLRDFATAEVRDFHAKGAALYAETGAISYLLPDKDAPERDLSRFYTRVRGRLLNRLDLPAGATEGEIVDKIISGANGWRDAFRRAYPNTPQAGLNHIRSLIRAQVLQLITEQPADGTEPLLPSLRAKLIAAPKDEESDLHGLLAGLIPASFIPEGRGHLKVLVSYPAENRSPAIEEFLAQALPNVSRQAGCMYAPNRAESLVVVIFRTDMGLEEVGEVRRIINLWAEAAAHPLKDDNLSWRQRLGYAQRSLQTSVPARARILHSLLTAMWDDLVEVDGPVESPTTVRVLPNRETGVQAVELALSGVANASSWGAIVDAYERFSMTDSDAKRRACEAISLRRPDWITTTAVPPSSTYRRFREIADQQPEILHSLKERVPEGAKPMVDHLLNFWEQVYPAALKYPFEGDAVYQNHESLWKGLT